MTLLDRSAIATSFSDTPLDRALRYGLRKTLSGRAAVQVVMPQDGHGFPVSAIIVQGGKPSCWCVP